jgi:hypothetical protein
LTETIFVQGLGTKAALVIFDTFEELFLHYRHGLKGFFEMLISAHAACPGLRVLITGRYPILTEKLTESVQNDDKKKPEAWIEKVQAVLEPFELKPLIEDERMRFLTDVCHVPADRPLAAIAKKSDGNPFILSLFGELALSRPLLTEKDVEDCPDVLFAYLIERVIDRIPDAEETEKDDDETRNRKRIQRAIRWLLRYAVVPSRLTREVFNGVLPKYLREEMAGQTNLDNPNDLGPAGKSRLKKPWRQMAKDFNLDQVWTALGDYASTSSWIIKTEDGFQLQPEVVVPMRELLRKNPEKFPIFDTLHLACARFYEDLAKSDRKRVGELLGEAVYHHFQREGQNAAPWWPILSQLATSPAAMKTLCQRILGRDFVDDQRLSLDHFRASKIISAHLLSRIAYQRCRAMVFLYLHGLIRGPRIPPRYLSELFRRLEALLTGAESTC